MSVCRYKDESGDLYRWSPPAVEHNLSENREEL